MELSWWVTHSRDPSTYLRKAPAFFPDAFLENDEIPIRDEWTQPLWISIRIPPPAGDPHVVYPGRKSLCSSIRWEVVRKGMEDYEYLRLLEQAVGRARGERRRDKAVSAATRLLTEVRNEIARDPLNYTRDDRLLLAAREKAGELLARLARDEFPGTEKDPALKKPRSAAKP